LYNARHLSVDFSFTIVELNNKKEIKQFDCTADDVTLSAVNFIL